MIRTNGRGVIYGEVWYEEELPGNAGVDIVQYRQRAAPVAHARTTPFLSLVSDLAVDETALIGAFGKDCRYKIRRADSKDGLALEFLTAPESRLEEFRCFFDGFAAQKSIEPADPGWLRAACQAGQLVLSAARRGGDVLVWHAHVADARSARLQHSASNFRSGDNEYRALVGRANRWLHWRDMLQFRERGLRRYDWGGLFADEGTPDRAGINKFKREFGGQTERSFDCLLPVTLKGRLYLPLRDAWRQARLMATR